MALEVELVKFSYTKRVTQDIALAHRNLNHDKSFRYLEAKKKKHKKSHEEEMGFPGHEKIEFGDIVQAPPKLSVPPRVSSWNFKLSKMDEAIVLFE